MNQEQPFKQRCLEIISRILGDGSAELKLQIYRLVVFSVGCITLVVIVPLNFVAMAPLALHVLTAVVCVSNFCLYALSRRGIQGYVFYPVYMVLLLDCAWWLNGKSEGPIIYFFAPLLLFSISLFHGGYRFLAAAGIILNTVGLHVWEGFHPPKGLFYESSLHRLLDHGVSIFSALWLTCVVGWFIINRYALEQIRLADLAARLKTSEDRHRQIFDSTSDVLLIYGDGDQLLGMNRRGGEFFGYEWADFKSMGIAAYSASRDAHQPSDFVKKIELARRQIPQVFEWLFRRKDGGLVWAEVALRAADLDRRVCVIASIRDISFRKQVQQELLTRTERLRLAMLASKQGWFEVNLKTGKAEISPEYARILGYDPAELEATIPEWLGAIYPDDRPEVERAFAACLKSDEAHVVEYRRRAKNGEWKWIRSIGRVVARDAEGNPLCLIGMQADVTERRELESRLLHSQRLEAVGSLASGVAHDLNNILAPMIMVTGLVRDKLADPADREMMTLIERSGRRGAAIVKQLLAFSRAVAPERKRLNPADLVEEVVEFVRSTFPKSIRVEAQLAPCAHAIEGDSTQLHQVLVNLAVNARDAMPEGGTLALSMETTLIPASETETGMDSTEPFLLLRVSDTGQGIPPEVRERIFDPFFTTKKLGTSTGLGLATVHGIVSAHRGFIRFDTATGKGTEFRVYLPLASPDQTTPQAELIKVASRSPLPPKTHTILVVDDEIALLRTSQRMLERAGHEVLTAGSGAEALQIVRERAPDIDLVITDFMMPEMDGPTMLGKIREIMPGLKAIGVSGLDQSKRAVGLGFSQVLQKPYEPDALLQAIEAAVKK